MQFAIYRAEDGWRWRLASGSDVIAVSAVAYSTLDECRAGVDAVKAAWRADVHILQGN